MVLWRRVRILGLGCGVAAMVLACGAPARDATDSGAMHPAPRRAPRSDRAEAGHRGGGERPPVPELRDGRGRRRRFGFA